MKGRLVLLVIILFILSASTIISNDTYVDPTITENLGEQETVSVVIKYNEEPEEPGILEAIFTNEIEQENILEEYYSAIDKIPSSGMDYQTPLLFYDDGLKPVHGWDKNEPVPESAWLNYLDNQFAKGVEISKAENYERESLSILTPF